MQQHGFARNLDWEVVSRDDKEGSSLESSTTSCLAAAAYSPRDSALAFDSHVGCVAHRYLIDLRDSISLLGTSNALQRTSGRSVLWGSGLSTLLT